MIDVDPTKITRDTLIDLLGDTEASDWQVQGFGMMRTYIGDDDRYRLQIWDMRLNTWGVSSIHDHPWDFTSTIICGTLWNQRYEFVHDERVGVKAHKSRIVPGPTGGTISEPEPCRVRAQPLEMYCAGEVYSQRWYELHRTRFDQGTATLIDRNRISPHGDQAWSVWETATNLPWISAKPRPATEDERTLVLELVLDRWFL